VTPANEPDFRQAKYVAGKVEMALMDKGYDYEEVDKELEKKGSKSCAIRKRNNPKKNKDLDKWRSKVRAPYEGVFSKLNKRTRYRGEVKVFMQCVMETIIHNLKKAVNFIDVDQYTGLELGL